LHEIEMLPSAPGARHLRGFLFKRSGKRVLACWHATGKGKVAWRLGGNMIVSGLDYIETDLSPEAVRMAWVAAEMEDF